MNDELVFKGGFKVETIGRPLTKVWEKELANLSSILSLCVANTGNVFETLFFSLFPFSTKYL
jgi:hypothetical protein